ncbi:MAG: hypothetical protein P8169_11030 [Chloroflexota bacterium]
MTRLWPDGLLLQVDEDGAGAPQWIRWEGQRHSIVNITRHWRVRSDWWREAVWRDYFKLITDSGLLLIIFHDLRSDEWYLQRLYD